MSDLTISLSTAFGILKRLKDINENIKNSEFSNLIADLSVELAEVKMKLAGVIEENVKLKEQVRTLQNADGDPCPKCRKRGWEPERSKPHPEFGEMGAINRTYKCSLCGFSETQLIVPRS
jgi:regulator of replication initiation timing